MKTPAKYAWIDVAISQQNFEVGAEVREAFLHANQDYAVYFIDKIDNHGQQKNLADLYGITRQILQ